MSELFGRLAHSVALGCSSCSAKGGAGAAAVDEADSRQFKTFSISSHCAVDARARAMPLIRELFATS
eukprot:233654-Alexandrium_andersonii.AAC.1